VTPAEGGPFPTRLSDFFVVPAKAATQGGHTSLAPGLRRGRLWIPAFAGMTKGEAEPGLLRRFERRGGFPLP
jgi:hypothetical protein